MKFDDMKIGQLLGASFDEGALPWLANKTFGYRVTGKGGTANHQYLNVTEVKTGKRHTFHNEGPDFKEDWANWKLIEDIVQA